MIIAIFFFEPFPTQLVSSIIQIIYFAHFRNQWFSNNDSRMFCRLNFWIVIHAKEFNDNET